MIAPFRENRAHTYRHSLVKSSSRNFNYGAVEVPILEKRVLNYKSKRDLPIYGSEIRHFKNSLFLAFLCISKNVLYVSSVVKYQVLCIRFNLLLIYISVFLTSCTWDIFLFYYSSWIFHIPIRIFVVKMCFNRTPCMHDTMKQK